MKSLNNLKIELFRKLAKYPEVEGFFKDSLQERIELDDTWTENILIQQILDEVYKEDGPLITLLKSITNDLPNKKLLQSKLTPKDEYDSKIKDVLAELNGYYNLKRYGFQKITAIPEVGTQKAPDFSAKFHDTDFLFEVKNMRAPIDVANTLFDKITERRLLVPGVYDILRLDIKISNS